MVGSRILDVNESPNGILKMTILKNGVKNFIVWTTQTQATFYIPSSWNVHTATYVEGIQTNITPGGSLQINGQPQILRP